MAGELSIKRVAISKANAQTIIITAAAGFITVFCIVASNYMYSLIGYQNRVIAADKKADSQLKTDVNAESRLVSQYSQFVQQNPTVIGQPTSNTSQLKYNNATVILDALPSQYDFPALTTMLQKLLTSNNLNLTSLGGQDESATMSNSPEANPQAVEIPFSFTISGASYQSIQQLFKNLENSVRPIVIDNISLSGTDSSMNLTVSAHTYYQPKKIFQIKTETVQ